MSPSRRRAPGVSPSLPTEKRPVPRRASERVRTEWARRVEAEYRSAAITQHLTLWLTQIGAAPELLERGLAIAHDELEHARLSWEVLLAAGGEARPALDRASLALPRVAGEPLEHDVLRACVDVFCLHETAAVPLFRALREAAEEPSARRALDRILVDEVRHRDFGWALLEWLLATEPRLVERARAELPAQLDGLVRGYAPRGLPTLAEAAPGGRSDERRLPAADARWGLMTPARYAEAIERCLERDLVPRFRAFGIDARAALPVAAPAASATTARATRR